SRVLHAIARDRARRRVEADLKFAWNRLEGEGVLEPIDGEITTFRAGSEPGLTRVELTVSQGDVVCRAEAQITVTASLLGRTQGGDTTYQGLPGYTYHKAAGELWRSRFDAERNLVVNNFVGIAPDQLLERLLELTLYSEENLR